MKNIIIIPPNGKRTKAIVIQGMFKEETEKDKNKRDKIILKTFLSFGLTDNKTSYINLNDKATNKTK